MLSIFQRYRGNAIITIFSQYMEYIRTQTHSTYTKLFLVKSYSLCPKTNSRIILKESLTDRFWFG